jgi:hypothetical protein
VDFIPNLDPIGLPESRYEGRLGGKGTLGKKTYISHGDDSFNKAHYTVLRNSTVVEPYIEKHMNFVRSENPVKNEAWIMHHHMEIFGDWLHKKCQGDKTIGDELYLLARQVAWHVLTYKGYEINGNTFYTVSQDKKYQQKQWCRRGCYGTEWEYTHILWSHRGDLGTRLCT